ncbi:accessory gland protein Acp29AB-like [Drosophila sulfurigaster albostrigata]|uniref:accessory gland protein Acp29AB-like n=1 Tax=Drosophila sulfurigaster albostrigata TaxID=89887 RepID=UPI002D21B94E|nr:accessory gland protein Acp29AB-like [Drosophila sulfurigaster albostrigata]
MHKQILLISNIYCILLLFPLGSALYEPVLNGNRSAVFINHNIGDVFYAEIPEGFVKIGYMFLHIDQTEIVNWFGAVEKCRRINGHLINLQSLDDLKNLQNHLDTSIEYWTDLNNLVKTVYFYSLTTGTKAELLNEPSKDKRDSYMCGILRFNKEEEKFELVEKNCTSKTGRPICQTTHPTTIDVVIIDN